MRSDLDGGEGFEWSLGEFLVTTRSECFDVVAIHRFLTTSYWANGIDQDTVVRSIAHSLGFAVLHGERQIGFARVISDHATFAYLADVYIEEEYRGRGLGKMLMACIMSHPALQRLRRWMLNTRDAHQLYRQYGFTELAAPAKAMEILDADIYLRIRPGVGGTDGSER